MEATDHDNGTSADIIFCFKMMLPLKIANSTLPPLQDCRIKQRFLYQKGTKVKMIYSQPAYLNSLFFTYIYVDKALPYY